MIDIAEIKIKAGNGGDGKVSFRREKYISKGGPDGGDGGKGGNIYLMADDNMATLIDFKSKNMIEAQNGEPGGKKKMTGKNGEDLFVKVPVGTLIYEMRDKDEVLVADMNAKGMEFLIALGGVGGKGNFRFRSSTNQSPMQYTKGTLGDQKKIKLEVKLVADVGIIGLPNAGKSTLLNVLTRANAKVSSYPFTTLSPNLGTVLLKSGKTVVLSDIPGLIEGASEGKGLGDEFLRHVERTRILVHLIDPLEGVSDVSECQENAFRKYETIRNELKNYGKGLEDKNEIIVINKLDLAEVKTQFNDIKKYFAKKIKNPVIGISGVTGEGVETLLNFIEENLSKIEKKVEFDVVTPVKLYDIGNLPNKRIVFHDTKVDISEQ
ncbi:GTPase ObgE [candidate division WWE3 bacterium]|uniref:GTPase Obg n=1 Tax=candidate division WWE3 bacterium TaxID=2053526 RepID=A0A3A4ZM48_UNCKA|nr:MAG: GTPase ObgE [candidate division WWE3 bacterium]